QVNDAMCRMLDYPEDDLIGQSFIDITLEEDREASEGFYNHLMRTDDRTYQMEKRYRKADGSTIWGLLTISKFKNAGHEWFSLGMVQDITELKQREAEIQRQNTRLKKLIDHRSQQALNSERLASVGRLTAGYSHQIRNPLQCIFCCLDRIEALTAGDPESYREVSEIRGGLRRIADLSDKLRHLYMPHEKSLNHFDVNEIVSEVVNLYFSQIRDAGIEISLDLHQPEAIVYADETVVYAALGNLLLNGIDAMDKGGRFTIRTAPSTEFVHLAVIDTGHGIDPSIKSRIFEPFFTTKSPDEGSGLGLAMVKESLERIGGSIEVSGEKGRGACFTMLLPYATVGQ
ncbi:MAG: sensor histidine kinase, partial [Candidatus Zixiibacteriota bacterium]